MNSYTDHHFTNYKLNRGHAPEEAAWQAQLVASRSRFLVMWQSQHLITEEATPQPVLLTAKEAEPWIQHAASVTALGDDEEQTYLVIDLPADEDPPTPLIRRGHFAGLRDIAMQAGHFESGLLAYAQAMTHWHRQHRFCGACGHPTESIGGGQIRRCKNPACKQLHFPRTDPAIIVRTTWEQGPQARILLGRQPHWSRGRYSNIAGFVSPGENLEDAVLREVLEETGVRVRNVHYHSSQPWPFPQSLMVGFTAEAVSPELCVGLECGDGELEDARWFSRHEIRQGLETGTFDLPSQISIAFNLIESWFDQGTEDPLRDLLHKGA